MPPLPDVVIVPVLPIHILDAPDSVPALGDAFTVIVLTAKQPPETV